MKFLEMEITREDVGIKLKVKSPMIADTIRKMSELAFGRLELYDSSIQGSLWGNYKMVKTNTILAGWTSSQAHGLIAGSAVNTPWIYHKDLGEGAEIMLAFPASAVAIREYSERVKQVAENHYKEHYAPFRFEVVINIEEEEEA